MLRKIKGKNRSGQQRKRCLDSITDSMDMNLSKLLETVKGKGAWNAAVCCKESDKTERLKNNEQYISNHYTVCLKLTQCNFNSISIKLKN